MAAERQVRAMGTDVHVVVVGPDRLADRAVARIEDLEARWSRFRPTSEVSAMNAAGGRPLAVSADTLLLVERAIEAWRMSAGFVDCTLLEPLVAAGYDRTFDDLPVEGEARDRGATPPSLLGPLDIEVVDDAVRLPVGVGFDPGGIGKGLAADLVAAELRADGADGVCINLGGDLRVSGVAPDGGAWTISIDHPHRPAPVALVGLADGAVATSTTLRRRWTVDGVEHHHLLDPRTGQPSDSDIAFCSVLAGSAWTAEVLAKAVLLRGGPHPFDLVEATGAAALVVDRDGAVSATPELALHLGGVPLPTHLGAQPAEAVG